MSIQFKHYPIEVEQDGILVKGKIVYWSKDYQVILTHPAYAEHPGLHMMYMIPARFVTPLDTDKIENVGDIDIVDRCKEVLKRLYLESLND